MAKRGILDHPKTLGLAATLDIAPCFAVGVLECLFQWVAKHHFTGELTGTKKRSLATALRYDGDPTALWAALVENGVIDELEDGRSVLHDFHEHADNTVRQSLDRAGKSFWNGAPSRLPALGRPRSTPEIPQKLHTVEFKKPLPEPEPEPEPLTEEQPPPPSASAPLLPALIEKRRSRKAPGDFVPNEADVAKAARLGLTHQQAREALEAFLDHDFDKPKLDWHGTFRNWLQRDARQFGAHRQPGRPLSRDERTQASFAEVEALDRLAKGEA